MKILVMCGTDQLFKRLARIFAEIGPARRKKILHAQHTVGQCWCRLYDNIPTHQILLSQDPVDALGQ